MTGGRDSSTNPREHVKPKDVVAIVRLVDLLHEVAEKPNAWPLITFQFQRAAERMKPKYRAGMEGIVREVKAAARRDEEEEPLDTAAPAALPDDVYYRLASLLPIGTRPRTTPTHELLRNPNGALLSEVLAPFVERAMARRLLVLRHSTPAPNAALSDREQEVYGRIVSGETNAEIARALPVTTETVKTYVSRMFRKLGVRSRLDLLRRIRPRGRDDE